MRKLYENEVSKVTINEKIRIKSNKIGKKRKSEEIYRKWTIE